MSKPGYRHYLCTNDGDMDFSQARVELPKIKPVDNKNPRNEDGLTEEFAGTLGMLADMIEKLECNDIEALDMIGLIDGQIKKLIRLSPHTFPENKPTATRWKQTGVFMVPMMGQYYESIDSWRSPKLCTGQVKDPRWILGKVEE